MTESYPAGEAVRLTIDFAQHPDPPYLSLRRSAEDVDLTATLRQIDDGTVCWRRADADPVVITATLADDCLQVRRPRAVELQLDAGEPAAPGTYAYQGTLEYDGSRYVWPREPREIEFVDVES